MNIEDWEKAIKAWQSIKNQAEMDITQADLFIAAIEKKLKEMKEDGK